MPANLSVAGKPMIEEGAAPVNGYDGAASDSSAASLPTLADPNQVAEIPRGHYVPIQLTAAHMV